MPGEIRKIEVEEGAVVILPPSVLAYPIRSISVDAGGLLVIKAMKTDDILRLIAAMKGTPS